MDAALISVRYHIKAACLKNPNSYGSELKYSLSLVAYCFSEVKGFSKFGEYSGGNANANGPFVYLGFKPAFVLVRDSDNAENWLMYDNERPGRDLNNNH